MYKKNIWTFSIKGASAVSTEQETWCSSYDFVYLQMVANLIHVSGVLQTEFGIG